MSTALKRGRTLDKGAVAEARRWRRQRLNALLRRDRTTLSAKERSEARRLSGRWDFWNASTFPIKG